MLSPDQIRLARERVEAVTGVSLPWPVAVTACGEDALVVRLGADSASITANDVNTLARGFFLLSRAVREGWPPQEIRQQRRFKSCGVMLDMSRGAVMKVEAVRRAIDRVAALGMNLLMLYTEDTFEVPEYPAFGYLRGGYTQAELRGLDAYAAALGVELVPCIQTLAHLAQFLQWRDAAPLCDLPDVLLADEPQTYAFIEAEIRAVSSCMRSRRIHIGMDEAHGVGLGRYYAIHGPTDRFQLLTRHLGRVADICRAQGLQPIMWSDMFFRLGCPSGDYYDPQAVVPDSVIRSLPPDVTMCYWDYYHTDESFYDHMLAEHARMGRETVFAGGIWTWSGFLPQVRRTRSTMRAALRACARRRVDTVLATLWGDDGAETNAMLGFSLLPIFSEACWQGPQADAQDVARAGECLTGLPRDALDAFGALYPDERDERPGKQLIWCDPLYPMLHFARGDSMDALLSRSRRAIQTLRPYAEASLECRYALALFEVCAAKGELLDGLRPRYLAGDRAWLREAAKTRIPALREAYARLMCLHRTLWERDNRRFGWEVLALRYGGAQARLADVQDELERYLAGELTCIEELNAEPLGLVKAGDPSFYARIATPSRDVWQLT